MTFKKTRGTTFGKIFFKENTAGSLLPLTLAIKFWGHASNNLIVDPPRKNSFQFFSKNLLTLRIDSGTVADFCCKKDHFCKNFRGRL